VLDLAFRPDPADPAPVHRQLETRLRALIAAGRLVAGQKLPATRELATAIGVGRNTVTRAYADLAEAGLVAAHVGQGTFVARRAGTSVVSGAATARGFVWESLFATTSRAPRLPRADSVRSAEVRFDFRAGRVDGAALPRDALRRAFARASRDLASLANAMDPFGLPALRQEIARALVGRGVECGADDVLVTAGAQQALDLVARALLEPGDAVAIEQPGYFGAALAFESRGATLVPIGVDREGLRTDELARAMRARRLKLVYVTPAVQCPTGVVLSAARRAALLALADEHQTPVVEDDYDAQLRLGTKQSSPALAASDAAGQVVHVGTFSKALFPGLRLGYVVAAAPLRERLARGALAASFGCSPLVQALLVELVRGGALERHVRRMRRAYAEREAALATALAATLPPEASFNRPAGGTCLWLTLPPGTDAARLHERARTAGILVSRGESFFADGRGAEHLLLSFACHPPAELARGARELGALVREASAGRFEPARARSGAPASRPLEGAAP
jgi:GntR family transcriptional regulator/MocR family aminotransferase